MWGTRPLSDTNPELVVLEAPNLCREYRVENWHLSRDGSGKVIQGSNFLAWTDAVFVALASLVWSWAKSHAAYFVCIVILFALLIYLKCTQVLWESVLVIPPHGIQLETHRGFPSYPLFASRSFIPLTELQDFVINEGLRGWDVRYYLAALYKPSAGVLRVKVAYENILPHSPVLKEIYRGVHEYLQTSIDETKELHRYVKA
ncbi:hypothetical protein BV25DRAFT_1885654 [Artomyces pyxidatus]|uniref:Uncharacterized protein n=1 Tax=Artomyces pyxidatus TaxID=48021 RepID=A0ACB8T1J1_9AGAM|nr:hypothetical protein BV25DRAFT_1885654 [Artomyces pyxidatus]